MFASSLVATGVLFTLAGPAVAQTIEAPVMPTATAVAAPSTSSVFPKTEPEAAAMVRPLLKEPSVSTSLGRDVRHFFSSDTAKVVGTFAIAGLAASHWDRAAVDEAGERLSARTFSIGNAIGSLYAQAGAGAATFMVGKVTNNPTVTSLGSELIRAQVLAQMFVQGTKFAVGRQRPDGSNSQSFPSGHSASTFATATVLQQHFGWKVGVPAYAMASFVASSRMAADKHYLSDVLIGAGIGIAAGRTVSFKVGGEKFALGAAPTSGGAMVTFTKK